MAKEGLNSIAMLAKLAAEQTYAAAQPAADSTQSGFSPWRAIRDFGTASAISTAGTTAGLGAAGLLAHRYKMPMLKSLFNNAAKESLLFFNPVRSFKLLGRLREASKLTKGQMEFADNLMAKPILPDINKLQVTAVANPAKAQQAALNEVKTHAGRLADLQNLQNATKSYNQRYGEMPAQTLEKGIGVANGLMNLGVGGAVGLLPEFSKLLPGSTTPTNPVSATTPRLS